ncbi:MULTISPECIES: hypothetical protein [unclassified Roseateles]|uniref:hypothetical protein n=1 Tax=unclassified Roseateles TaxID=2626991 RepID=UPI00138EE134|nr:MULTISPECIES: hypothetical protein [unclassified Roseateles]
MADISTSRSKALRPDFGPGGDDPSVLVAANTDPHAAWTLLDEASEDLVRAEAIVDLLGLEMQASRHQLYSAQVAGEFLRAASERVSEARDLIREVDLASRSQQVTHK